MLKVHKISPDDWALLAENAHRAIFNETKPATQERIDFALLVVDAKTDDVYSYVTCKEFAPDFLYWSYGGAFPLAAGGMLAWRCYQAMMDLCLDFGYKQVFYLIENTNAPMLKMAAKGGAKIIGLRQVEGVTLLEHEVRAP